MRDDNSPGGGQHGELGDLQHPDAEQVRLKLKALT
jgi:hypothetical protein